MNVKKFETPRHFPQWGTQHTDLVEKNDQYRETPATQRYIILEQTLIGGIASVCSNDGRWTSSTLNGAEGVVNLPEIGITLPPSEFYAGMNLAKTTTAHPNPPDDTRRAGYTNGPIQ